MHHLHLGELLVRNGLMTPAQRDAVLEAQRSRGGPFGAIAEEMFGISPGAVEEAWAEQYASFAPTVDPRVVPITDRTLEVISRRQAWQFRVLPLELRHDGLVVCTTQEGLVRALRFAGWRLGHQCRFVLTQPMRLGEALCTYYPMAGMTPESVCGKVGV
ncbi:MAG TPA: hypothetical protein VD971_05620 [Phycisphaerales bacterium]|nr:hypothetical protein [Phycisphaerales bacterium]